MGNDEDNWTLPSKFDEDNSDDNKEKNSSSDYHSYDHRKRASFYEEKMRI